MKHSAFNNHPLLCLYLLQNYSITDTNVFFSLKYTLLIYTTLVTIASIFNVPGFKNELLND